MKKYFQFTTFRKGWKPFLVTVIATIVGQYRNGRMSVYEIIITDFMIVIMCLFVTLVIDWVQMTRSNLNK